MNTSNAAASYNSVRNHSGLGDSSPHRLIEMLFDGLVERITQAKGAMQYKNYELKGKKINSAIAIVSGLRESLDKDQGGEIAENLDALYIYITKILSQGNIENESKYLDEALELVGNVHEAWKQIAS